MMDKYIYFLDYIMKLKIKGDITSTFVKTFKEATGYCNISDKPYSYPLLVIYVKNNIIFLNIFINCLLYYFVYRSNV